MAAYSMVRGDTMAITHTITDEAGAPLNLAGPTLRTVFNRRRGAPEAEGFAKTPTVVGAAAEGIARTTLVPADTSSLVGSTILHYELQAVITGGVYTLARGGARGGRGAATGAAWRESPIT